MSSCFTLFISLFVISSLRHVCQVNAAIVSGTVAVETVSRVHRNVGIKVYIPKTCRTSNPTGDKCYVTSDNVTSFCCESPLRRFVCVKNKCFDSGADGNFLQSLHQLEIALQEADSNSTASLPFCAPSTTPINISFAPKQLVFGQRRKLALLFLTRGRMTQPNIWHDWFDSAEKHFGPALWDEALSVYTHVSLRPTNVMASPGTQLPPELLARTIPTTPGKWGDLNGIEHALLTEALKDPDNQGFLIISDTAIPVKPFKYIHTEFFKNPRSRFDFSGLPYPAMFRKHTQWVTLNRKHAEALQANPALWVCHRWLSSTFKDTKIYAAPDEYLIYYALLQIYGYTTLQQEINAGTVYELGSAYAPKSLHGQRYDDSRFKHTLTFWDKSNCGKVGVCADNRRVPLAFWALHIQPLMEIVFKEKDAWFMRKVKPQCNVHRSWHPDSPSTPLSKILPELLTLFASIN